MLRTKTLTRALILFGSLGIVLAGQTPARAGLKVGAGGIKVLGDPYIDYVFEVYLDDGSVMKPHDYFKINNVVGVGANPLHSEPGDDVPDYGFSTTSVGNLPFPSPYDPAHGYGTYPSSNVEWKNASGGNLGSGLNSPFYLGEFIVQSTVSVPDLQAPFTITLDYTTSVPGGGGTVTLPVLTPEPSTIVIAGLAGVFAVGFALSRRATHPA